MKFTLIPNDVAKNIQLNAGVLLKGATAFDPSSPTISRSAIFAATSGGVNFTDTPTYTDFGEDIDNCPKNTMELKELDSREIKISGTMLTITPTIAKSLSGGADIDSNDSTHIIPRNDVVEEDFDDFWWVGDYSDKNGATNGGFAAIHLMNCLSTGGLSIQSGDKTKGQFSFEYTAHYSLDDPDEVPYEMFIKVGTAEPTQSSSNSGSGTGTGT